MSASGTSAGLGLLSAVSWGGSDFAGGMGARRASALLVAVSGHFASLLVLLAVCLALHLPLPAARFLFFSALGGFEGAIALAVFYRALAMGAMGLTAAFTGLLTALVPTVFAAFRYGLPTSHTAAGLAAGCAAIWLITHQPVAHARQAAPSAALLMGALAGVGFGTQLICFKIAGGGGLLWVMTVARAAGVTALVLVLLLARPPARSRRGFWLPGIVAGMLDTVGNLFYLRAAQLGRLDAAAVICSLYPAGTILLAALVLREHPSRRQWAGMALALAAVALLAV